MGDCNSDGTRDKKHFNTAVESKLLGRLAPLGGSSQAPGSAVEAETPPTGSHSAQSAPKHDSL